MSTTATLLSSEDYLNCFYPVGALMAFLDFDKREAYYDYITADTTLSGCTFEKGAMQYRNKYIYYVKRTK